MAWDLFLPVDREQISFLALLDLFAVFDAAVSEIFLSHVREVAGVLNMVFKVVNIFRGRLHTAIRHCTSSSRSLSYRLESYKDQLMQSLSELV